MKLFKLTSGYGVKSGRANAMITVNTDVVKDIPAVTKQGIKNLGRSIVSVGRKASAATMNGAATVLDKSAEAVARRTTKA